MKYVLCSWLVGLGLLVSHVGCCAVHTVGGNGCGIDPCNSCSSCGDGEIHMPFGGLRSRIANHVHASRCGAACGEVYWDERINEPPVCDPCGCNGEFTGETCGSCPTALGRLRNLWGYRYYPSNCESCNAGGSASCSSCSSCSSSSNESYSSSPSTHVHDAGETHPMNAQPTPATRPSKKPDLDPPATPEPDSNAMRSRTSSDRLVIGSGTVPNKSSRTVQAKPSSTKKSTQVQGRPKLVTTSR